MELMQAHHQWASRPADQRFVSLTELAEYRGQFGLGIERDLGFKPRGPISAYIEAASDAGHIVENIPQGEVTD